MPAGPSGRTTPRNANSGEQVARFATASMRRTLWTLFRIPAFDPADGRRIVGELCWPRPVDLGDDRRGRSLEEGLDALPRRYERSCELRKRSLADDDQQPHSV